MHRSNNETYPVFGKSLFQRFHKTIHKTYVDENLPIDICM